MLQKNYIFFKKFPKIENSKIEKKQFQKSKKSNFYHNKTKKGIFKYLLAVKVYNLNSWKLIMFPNHYKA